MRIAAAALLSTLASVSALAGDPATVLAKIRKNLPLPDAPYAVTNLVAVESASVLYANFREKYEGSPQAEEARLELVRIGERVGALRASILADLKPKEKTIDAALAKARVLADRLRAEVKARAPKGGPKLRAGACYALDYGGGESLYQLVVVKVERVAPGAAWGKLLYRARPGDVDSVAPYWPDVLEKAQAWEVPDQVFSGALPVNCSRGRELRDRFAAARQLGRDAAPLKDALERIKRIELFVRRKEILDERKNP